ncbi:Hypothetical_protein [Hexamita inflata]|uniref:Hypothetical_protein n=1 Tax=Hexamita inflata TaxID=28002 RepID=A0AA86Q9W9_9EUKA|nr:Hypothetical protein HINF_LOCUS35905 [Hexamita inflata]
MLIVEYRLLCDAYSRMDEYGRFSSNHLRIFLKLYTLEIAGINQFLAQISTFNAQINELIHLNKIFQTVKDKILVACKFLIEQELSFFNIFLNNDYELATHRIQVIDYLQSFTLLIFYFSKQPKYKLQVTAGIKYRIEEVLARIYNSANDFQK